MANFIVTIDANRERRIDFMNSVRPELAPVEGLIPGESSLGDFHLLWSADSRAPVSQSTFAGGTTVIWGDAARSEDKDRLSAADISRLWFDPECRRRTVLSGFFAGVVYRPDVGLILGCDLLGVYPIYYYAGGDYLLVGSSPELFKRHPAFKAEFNPVGLVGMLLTMHSFGGETLLKGVKRLAAGHHLCIAPDSQISEQLHYRLPVSTDHFNLPFSAHVDILDEVFRQQIGKHLPPDEACSFLLSGGLDSRLLGAYLEQNKIAAQALTLGVADDIEMQCAAGVARALKYSHQGIDIPFSSYPDCAEVQVKWEHLANGFNNGMEWGLYPHLRKHGSRVVMGHMLDAVIGTRYINWAYSATTKSMSFANFFSQVNSWGFRPELLKKLLRKEIFGDLVDETLDRIKTVYESYSELESQRAWCFNLQHRQRFHVGSSAWACSFGAWPVVPALDERFLACAGGMPAATIAERRAQIELLCERFPQLAALPLDRNSYHTRPLRPRLRYLLRQSLLKPFTALRERNGTEKRFYVRVFDINGTGWQAIRRQAEEGREQSGALFNLDILNEILPGPAARLSLQNEIIDASGLKSLLGLMLWSKRNL